MSPRENVPVVPGPTPPRRPWPRGRAAGAAVVGLVLLSACGGIDRPGVAATVEGEPITTEDVDAFASALCSLNTAGEAPVPEALKSVRARSLQFLIDNEVASQVADPDLADRAEVEAILDQAQAARDALPAESAEPFEEVVRDYAVAQSALTELGRQSLVEQGATEEELTDEQAVAEGDRLRREYAAQADIEVDPRFGSLEDGVVTPDGGSLSVPVSEVAVTGADPEVGAELVDALPDVLTCR